MKKKSVLPGGKADATEENRRGEKNRYSVFSFLEGVPVEKSEE